MHSRPAEFSETRGSIMTAGGRRGPKPKGGPTELGDPFKDKRRTLSTRITEETRAKLDGAAANFGRSLSQEIEFRLDQSFKIEEEFGDPDTQRFLRLLAAVRPHSEWTHSLFSRQTVFRDWTRRVFEETPSRLAMDLMYLKEKKGNKAAQDLAKDYYIFVTANFTKRDQQEYRKSVEEITGLSMEHLGSRERSGRE
jgi:hypothetical protein